MFYLYRHINNNIMYFTVFIFTIYGLNIIPILLHNNSFLSTHLNITKGKFVDLMTDKGTVWQNVEIIEIVQINETDNTVNKIEHTEHTEHINENSIIEISVRRRLRGHGHAHGHSHPTSGHNCKSYTNC